MINTELLNGILKNLEKTMKEQLKNAEEINNKIYKLKAEIEEAEDQIFMLDAMKAQLKTKLKANQEELKILQETKNKMKLGNYTLNVYNHQTENELKNLGIEKLTISPELNESTINSITKNKDVDQELIVYGKTPLMTINYCLLGKANKCHPDCKVYCLENKEYYLKDRLGFTFRIIPDRIQTVSTIYNSKITSIDGSIFNVSSYRIDILDESIDDINSIVETVLAKKRLEGKDYTNGNLNREI